METDGRLQIDRGISMSDSAVDLTHAGSPVYPLGEGPEAPLRSNADADLGGFGVAAPPGQQQQPANDPADPEVPGEIEI